MYVTYHFLFLIYSVAILLSVLLPSLEITLELIFRPSPFLSFLINFCFSSC